MSYLLLQHPKHHTLTVPSAIMERYETHPLCRLDLFHRDCLLGLEEMVQGGLSADVVVTSPPYNIGRDYDGYDDERPEAEYRDWLKDVFRAVSRILAADGSLFVNLAGPPSDPLKPWRIIQHCLLPELGVQNVFHWVKHWSLGDEPTTGHCTPINSARYVNNGHEYVFHCTWKKDVTLDKLALGVPYADKSNLTRGTRGKNGDLRDRGNIWMIPYETIQRRASDRPHPATFPEELVRRCLKIHGLEKIRRVVDPFMGLGTTARVCAGLEKSFIGFELCETYWEQACLRTEQALRRLRADR